MCYGICSYEDSNGECSLTSRERAEKCPEMLQINGETSDSDSDCNFTQDDRWYKESIPQAEEVDSADK